MIDDDDETGSEDEFIVNAFRDDSESSDDEHPTQYRKRKLPDGDPSTITKKQRFSTDDVIENNKVKDVRFEQWAERSISLMLNLRLQLYKVFEHDDERVQKRAWKKIASLLFPLNITGEDCQQRFNSLMEKFLASYDPDLGAVACGEDEEEHFRFIEKLLKKSPRLRHQYLSAAERPTADYPLDSAATNLNGAFVQSLVSNDSVLAVSFRKLAKMRRRQEERDRVFEEIIDDIISMQGQKHAMERAFLRKFVFSEFETRDEQLGMLAQTLMSLGCSESVPVAIVEHVRREVNQRADKRCSISVLMSAYSGLLEKLFDVSEEEEKLLLELLPDSSHLFIPEAALTHHVILTEFGFKGLLRLDRTTVEKVIEVFGPSSPARIGQFKPISIERVVLLSLWYLVHDETSDQLSIRFSIRESDVRQAIRTFASILSDADDLIEWPDRLSDIKQAVLGFENMRDSSFPGVVGALGTKKFLVRSPDVITEKDLLDGDYLLDYDIGVQAIVDSNQVFRSVEIKWIIEDELENLLTNARKRLMDGGLKIHNKVSHPDRIFSRTGLCNMLARRNDKWAEEDGKAFLPDNLHVLGDSSYPLLISLMVPFDQKSDLKPKESLFNKQWELSWSVVSKAFGKAINRFQRLSCLDYSLICTDMIKAIFAVHNICMKGGDNYPARRVILNNFPTWFPESSPKPEAIQKRQNIMNQFVLEKINYAYRGKPQIRSVPLN